jgi:hypothetical protein
MLKERRHFSTSRRWKIALNVIVCPYKRNHIRPTFLNVAGIFIASQVYCYTNFATVHDKEPQQSLSVSGVVKSFCPSKCRDHQNPVEIEPDYSKSVTSVFFTWTMFLFQTGPIFNRLLLL